MSLQMCFKNLTLNCELYIHCVFPLFAKKIRKQKLQQTTTIFHFAPVAKTDNFGYREQT